MYTEGLRRTDRRRGGALGGNLLKFRWVLTETEDGGIQQKHSIRE